MTLLKKRKNRKVREPTNWESSHPKKLKTRTRERLKKPCQGIHCCPTKFLEPHKFPLIPTMFIQKVRLKLFRRNKQNYSYPLFRATTCSKNPLSIASPLIFFGYDEKVASGMVFRKDVVDFWTTQNRRSTLAHFIFISRL